MKDCPRCHKEISSKSFFCPHCGHTSYYYLINVLIALGVIALIVVIIDKSFESFDHITVFLSSIFA